MQTRDGGKPNVKDLPYCPPEGPKGQSHEGPGLGGSNYGNNPKGAESGGKSSIPVDRH